MDAIESARQLVPWWVGWGSLDFWAPVSFVLVFCSAGIAVWIALRSMRGHDDDTWVERARFIYPARYVSRFNILSALFIPVGTAHIATGPISRVPRSLNCLLCLFAASCGALFWIYVVERKARRTLSVSYWLQGSASAALIIWSHLIVALIVASILLLEVDSSAVAILSCGLLATIFFNLFGGGVWLAQAFGLAKKADGRLADAMQAACKHTGISLRGCYEFVSPAANALALPLCRRVLFADGATSVLSDEELQAVCVHELAHLAEPRSMKWARALGGFVFLMLATSAMLVLIGEPALAVLLTLIWIAGLIVLTRMARRMEERADKLAHSNEESEGTYARALEKLYEARLAPVVMRGKRHVHPNLYDRMVAAGVTPRYPRPRPPRWKPEIAIVVSIFLTMVGIVALLVGVESGSYQARENESLLYGFIAVTGGRHANDFSNLARIYYNNGDLVRADAFASAASAIDTEEGYYPALQGFIFAKSNRFSEAQAAIREAQRRFKSHHASTVSLDMLEMAQDELAAQKWK